MSIPSSNPDLYLCLCPHTFWRFLFLQVNISQQPWYPERLKKTSCSSHFNFFFSVLFNSSKYEFLRSLSLLFIRILAMVFCCSFFLPTSLPFFFLFHCLFWYRFSCFVLFLSLSLSVCLSVSRTHNLLFSNVYFLSIALSDRKISSRCADRPQDSLARKEGIRWSKSLCPREGKSCNIT